MGTTADKTLAEAARWLGYQESPYSEETPFGPMFGWYNDYEWCGIFCQYCIKTTGGTVGTSPNDTIPFTHYTVTGVQAFKALGRFYGTPKRGDLVYFRWGNYGDPVHHVGFVEDASNWPNSIRTIEGNINEAVGRFVRYNNGQIVGFGRPLYVAATQLVVPFKDELSPEAIVFHWLKENGLSDAGAAGVMGNLQQESNFRFNVVEGGGTDVSVIDDVRYSGVGVLQWSFSRRVNLFQFAKSRNMPWQDPGVQLDFMLQEIKADSRYVKMWDSLSKATDPVEAAKLFDDVFVRSGTKGSRFTNAVDFFNKIKAGVYGTFVDSNKIKVAHKAVPAFT